MARVMAGLGEFVCKCGRKTDIVFYFEGLEHEKICGRCFAESLTGKDIIIYEEVADKIQEYEELIEEYERMEHEYEELKEQVMEDEAEAKRKLEIEAEMKTTGEWVYD